MKRRNFLVLSAGFLGLGSLVHAADSKPAAVTEKDILKEGQPASIANYCENPSKQPNKFCPTKPAGICSDCTFYNKDNSKTKYKGKEVAKCQLLATAPSYVYSTASCATFVKKP
jgi:hypothetical protein